MRRPRRPHALSVVLALVAAFLLGGGSTAAGAPPAPPDQAPLPAPEIASSHLVTLVTGDQVRLDISADGQHRATVVREAAGSSYYQTFTHRGEAYVIPQSATELLAEGRLDIRLFNVSLLVEQGLSDASSDSIPLLITHDSPAAAAAPLGTAAAPSGASNVRALPSIGGLALAEGKAQARQFWASVNEPRQGLAAADLSRGIEKIWLDARVTASLDKSVPAVGAPAAWARGYDGTGVTVAVLDTGIDPTHPDMQGMVVGSKDFTGKGNVVDGYGHGTHVSSILGGSGAASGGKFKGVAPGVDLMVGKVLDDGGRGRMSWIVAGMEWAARNGADVVNLSLGGPITGGEDPTSQALNTLTRQHGTLFVVAAGNHGPHASLTHNVTSPGVADLALTVGASQDNFVASFSSDGVMAESTIKPEIVAPGVGITAAHAAGTCCVEGPYVSNRGTSMAAPHVAGGAAIVLQQHPDWTPAQVKTALVSTADTLKFGLLPYQQGTGRLNVDRATAQDVRVDTGVLDMGYYTRPYDELTASRTITYRNSGDEPVSLTLDLRLDQQFDGPAPEGTLTASPAEFTLDPGASQEVTVSVDATDVPADTYGGWITAHGDDVKLTTAVGFYKQDDTVDVTFNAIDRNGDPAFGSMRVSQYKDFNNGLYYPQLLFFNPSQTEWTLRLPENVYSAFGLIGTPDESGRFIEEQTIIGKPEIRVDEPAFSVTLDAREATPLEVRTPRESQMRSAAVTWWRGADRRNVWQIQGVGFADWDGSPERLSAVPTEQVDEDPFAMITSFHQGVDPVTASVRGREFPVVHAGGPKIAGRHRLPLVDAGHATPEDLDGLDLKGKVALVQEAPDRSWASQVIAVAEAGARAIVQYSAQPGVFWPDMRGAPITVLTLPKDEGERMADLVRRRSSIRLNGQPVGPYSYELSFVERGRVPDDVSYEPRRWELASVRSEIHDVGQSDTGSWTRQHWLTDCDCGTLPLVDDAAVGGQVHTAYVTPSENLGIYRELQIQQFDTFMRYRAPNLAFYDRGDRVTEDWLEAPFAPGPMNSSFARLDQFTSERWRGLISYTIPSMRDSEGHAEWGGGDQQLASRLYREGSDTPLNESTFLSDRVPIPEEPGTYRLEADTSHDGSTFELSTRTHSEWTFHTSPPEGNSGPEVLPLVDVAYSHLSTGLFGRRDALNLDNEARDMRLTSLTMRAGHQAGSEAPDVEDLSLWVSYDDGGRWYQVPVLQSWHDSEVFTALYWHPPSRWTSGYVSLKVQASDSAGNSLEQTVIRAYELR